MPDPLCNVHVARFRRYGASTPTPRDIRRMATRLTKNRIKNDVGILSTGPFVDWWIDVYRADATKARHLVELAEQAGWQIEPVYSSDPSFPVLPRPNHALQRTEAGGARSLHP